VDNSKGFKLVGWLCLSVALSAGPLPAAKLSGTAEDMWGEAVNLAAYNRGTVILYPFSPSN
jgi:hypothetical protein